MTKKDFEALLNEIGVPEKYKKSTYGGWIPDNVKYGSWLRRNDPIMFDTEYWDYTRS